MDIIQNTMIIMNKIIHKGMGYLKRNTYNINIIIYKVNVYHMIKTLLYRCAIYLGKWIFIKEINNLYLELFFI